MQFGFIKSSFVGVELARSASIHLDEDPIALLCYILDRVELIMT